MVKKSGVYCLLNVLNNKKYIGSSKNLRNRKYDHFKMLRKGSHHNSRLQKEFDEFGENLFKFCILELVESDSLFDREQYWMDMCQSYDSGYNICRLSNSSKGCKRSHETIKKISEAHKGILNTEEQKKKISEKNKIIMKNNVNAAKIAIEQVKEIRAMSQEGVKNCELAKIFKLDSSQVSRIVNYKAFKHIS